MLVHFFEASGLHAKETLTTFARELAPMPELSSLELMQNLQQPEVFLLIVKSAGPLEITPPPGTRGWTFQTL
jgi:hypothetical protein